MFIVEETAWYWARSPEWAGPCEWTDGGVTGPASVGLRASLDVPCSRPRLSQHPLSSSATKQNMDNPSSWAQGSLEHPPGSCVLRACLLSVWPSLLLVRFQLQCGQGSLLLSPALPWLAGGPPQLCPVAVGLQRVHQGHRARSGRVTLFLLLPKLFQGLWGQRTCRCSGSALVSCPAQSGMG